METNDPRLRAMLRRADKVANGGKRQAAATLYRQILEEYPQNGTALAGLAAAEDPLAPQTDALREVADISRAWLEEVTASPSSLAKKEPLIPVVKEEPQHEEPVLETAVSSTTVSSTAVSDAETLVCYRHPKRETSLRCYRCNKPICIDCTNKTPVGYLCPECVRESEDTFFNAKPLDYLLVSLVAAPMGLLGGLLVSQFNAGFFIIFIMVIIGGAVGGFIGRLSKRVIGQRRGRYIPHVIAAWLIIGVILFSVLPMLFDMVVGAGFPLFSLIGPGAYLFGVVPAAMYWSK